MMRIAQLETAIDAYHTHVTKGKAHQQRARVLDFIRDRGGDWSIGEIAHELDLEKSTVSARINELLHETHDLVGKPKRKDRYSGITVRPVGFPLLGQMEIFN